MQRHPSMFRRGLLIWSVTLIAPPVSAALAQGEPPSPWTDKERANALVRIEAPGPNAKPDVATGFIVDGLSGTQYVATVTHGLLPGRGDYQNPDNCEALPAKTTLRQGNTGGPLLTHECAYHLGKDVSLVELSPGASPLPALPLLACGLVPSDDVYLGGFALGLDRITMVGEVRGNGSQGTIITDSLTAGGLSGGPYLTAAGHVVGIHQGVLRDSDGKESPGYATILPVQAMRLKLEAKLPPITTQAECPKPEQRITLTEIAGEDWNAGKDGDLALGVTDKEGVCFIVGVHGDFDHLDDRVWVEADSQGMYKLRGDEDGLGSHGATARCLKY